MRRGPVNPQTPRKRTPMPMLDLREETTLPADGFAGALAAPDHELHRREIAVAGLDREPDQFLALRIVDLGSAGEKQIYAIALLWALARTSARPLPMIIDTPLARLDADHRTNLIRSYFPHASHQVVLLSTDKELDHRLATAIRSSVSHSYRLDYDVSRRRTVVTPGYFEDLVSASEERYAFQQT